MGNNNLFIVLLIIGLLKYSESYFVTVDAHSEECFFDKVEAGTKMGIK